MVWPFPTACSFVTPATILRAATRLTCGWGLPLTTSQTWTPRDVRDVSQSRRSARRVIRMTPTTPVCPVMESSAESAPVLSTTRDTCWRGPPGSLRSRGILRRGPGRGRPRLVPLENPHHPSVLDVTMSRSCEMLRRSSVGFRCPLTPWPFRSASNWQTSYALAASKSVSTAERDRYW